MRWKLVLKGVGKLYRAIYDELETREHDSPAEAMAHAAYKVGTEFGQTLKKDFQLGSSIEDIAFVMDVEHKVFGMNATVTEKSERKIVYDCTECAWQKYFTPRLCNAIGQAEKGIAQAINPEAKYSILQTRTMGKERCIFSVEI